MAEFKGFISGHHLKNTDVAVLVISCDKYSDLWPVYFNTFFEYWSDLPYPVYLGANTMTYESDRVKTLHSVEDTDWSSSLRRILEQLPHKYVFLLFEDAFFKKSVKTDWFRELVNWAIVNDVSYFRFRPSPPPDIPVDDVKGQLSEYALYRTSLFLSLWKKEVLLNCLVDGETAWEFELKGHLRSAMYPDFYSTSKPLFSYIHGVEKGVWHRSAVRQLNRLGQHPNLSVRPMMSYFKTILWRISLIKSLILQLFPVKHQSLVLSLADKFYRFLGFRA